MFAEFVRYWPWLLGGLIIVVLVVCMAVADRRMNRELEDWSRQRYYKRLERERERERERFGR